MPPEDTYLRLHALFTSTVRKVGLERPEKALYDVRASSITMMVFIVFAFTSVKHKLLSFCTSAEWLSECASERAMSELALT